MPEHDAFGRPIGDDPLSALRGATEPDLGARVEPVEPALEREPAAPVFEAATPELAAAAPEAAHEPAVPRAPAPRTEFVQPRRHRRRRGGVVLLLAMALLIIGAVPAVVGVIATDVRDDIEGLLPDAIETAAPPVGLERDSMIRRDNFAAALATLRGAELGRPALLRVAPERIDATLVSGGRLSQVQVRFDGVLQESSTSNTGATPPTIPFDRIDPGAPERLVRRGAPRADTAARQIDYLVLSTGPGLPWGAYFKGGGIVQGDARGRPQRVL